MVGHWFNSAADFATQWLPLAFFGILVLTAWLLWKTVGMMPRVRPNRVDSRSKSSVTWDDVAGVEEVRGELMEVVDFLRDPARFERLGARVPKGLLLYGPPGTGKTLLAKAVAHESGANFYSASAASFVEMFAGLGAARIRKLFQQARKSAPAIVFIDELDAVGAARTGHGFNREQDQTLNQLLVELDGFDPTAQVVVMGASNRLQDLDPALLRPGRFDRQVLVSPPDLAGREEILRVHTRGKPLASDVDLTVIAKQTAGLTGAELPDICNEAAIFRRREDLQYIRQQEVDEAMEQVVFGRVTNGAANDLEKVTELARAMVFEYGMADVVTSRTLRADNYSLSEETKRLRDQEQARLTDHAFEEAVRLLTKHRASLDRVAQSLLEKETLVRDEVEALLADVPVESRSSDFVGVKQVIPLSGD